MESPKDTCAVAAAIVGLTEKRIADLDALAEIRHEATVSIANMCGSTVRVVQDYAALLNGCRLRKRPIRGCGGRQMVEAVCLK